MTTAVSTGITLLVLVHPQAADTLTLVDALRTALEVDPSLVASDARTDEAASAVEGAEAARLPSLSASLSSTRFEEPMPVAPFHGLDLQNAPVFERTLVQGRAGLAYTLWDGGARGARIDAAHARRDAADARRRTTRQEVLDRAVEAYLAVLTTRDVLAAQRLRRDELEAERARVARFLEEGTAARVELLRAEAELSAADAEVASAETRLELAEAELARLLELPPGSLAGRPLEDVRLVEGFASVRRSADSDSDHPALVASRKAVTAARAGTRQARAAWLPDVHVTAGFNEFGAVDARFTGEWQGGLRVEYPIFTGGARASTVEAAEARVRTARAEVRSVERDLSRAEDRARAAEREARARVVSLTDAVEQFEELARVEALALAEGVGVQRDFLRAQAGLLRARAGLAEARRAAILARVRLARARGRLDLDWITREVEALP